MIRAIFVCSGNVCRSPMAERIFRAEAARLGRRVNTLSMGTLGLVARRPTDEVIAVLDEIGVDARDHRSQGLGAALLGHATHIFVMERAHLEAIKRLDARLATRTRLLGEFDPERGADAEIADPIGQSIEVYRECRDRIVRCVGEVLARTPD